jgi:hypothetical protein
MSNRVALIGINPYRVLGADLRGCVPDVSNVCNFFTARITPSGI